MLVPCQAAAASRCLAASTVRRSRPFLAGKGMASTSYTAGELAGQSCSLLGGCSSETPKVALEQLPALMAVLPSWRLADDQASITRRFTAKNFMAAIKFFNSVAELAEAEGHHPDLHLTSYRDVEVVLSTHAIGGLSMHDFIMAAKLDCLPVEYSPKWLKQNQHVLGQAAEAAAAAGSAAP